MPDTNKTITALEAVKAASAAPVKPVAATAGENKVLNAAPIKPASVNKPATPDKLAVDLSKDPVESKASAAAPSKPAAAEQGRDPITASTAQPVSKPAAPSSKSTETEKSTAAQSQPKANTAAPKKTAAVQGKEPITASTAQPMSKPAAPTSKPTGTDTAAAASARGSLKANADPQVTFVAQGKNNLPSASTGNDLEKKEEGKLAIDRGDKLVIPDLILTAHPVVTAVEKITSRLSPGMKLVLFALLVPTFLSLIYFGLWASPMYIAEARFAVRGAESGAIETGGLASMLLPAGSTIGTDVNIVTEYIQSPDIMEAVDKELHIFDHFESHDYDIVSRLESDATRDERLDYWQWAVKPSLDPETGIVALSVKAYEPDVAKKLAEAVLDKSEALVNAMSRRAQDDAITLAMREVKTAEARVSKAQEAMRAFRDRSGMLDPTSTAGGLQSIVSQLESEVVKVKAEIAEASTYMSKDAPALVGLRARLAAVEKQLAAEKLRLAGESKTGSMTSIAGEYEDLQIESDFARQQLVSAMTSLEAARVKAEAQSRYVVAFQVPVLPDESLYPRPFLFTLFVFVGALVIVGICSLIIAAVREHAGF